MVTMYQSEFKQIIWDDANRVIRQVWIDTEALNDETLKNELLAYLRCVEEKKPDAILSFATNFHYGIIPEVQEWIGANILGPFGSHGVRSYAQIVSPDIFAQISIEQTLEENTAPDAMRFSMFDSEASALAWVNANRAK
jgi:hypothetical protein